MRTVSIETASDLLEWLEEREYYPDSKAYLDVYGCELRVFKEKKPQFS
jgi:hypothetical protein